jgi:L-ascorbate 6-phosphate lactonase
MNDSISAHAATGVEIRWLGQAGFAVRGSSATVAFDPYLSDFCRTVFGLERTMEPPCSPAEVGADIVLISHWHEDHLDLDSAAEFAASGAIFLAPPSCVARLVGRGIPAESVRAIERDQSMKMFEVTVTGVPAVHRVPGFLTEDAVGYLLDIDGVRIYHSGDTEYHRSLVGAGHRGPIDVALLCVNGTGGNMNAFEAAVLATQLRPVVAVPMHFGMWPPDAYGPGGTLDPAEFVDVYARLLPDAAVRIPTVADAHLVKGRE